MLNFIRFTFYKTMFLTVYVKLKCYLGICSSNLSHFLNMSLLHKSVEKRKKAIVKFKGSKYLVIKKTNLQLLCKLSHNKQLGTSQVYKRVRYNQVRYNQVRYKWVDLCCTMFIWD